MPCSARARPWRLGLLLLAVLSAVPSLAAGQTPVVLPAGATVEGQALVGETRAYVVGRVEGPSQPSAPYLRVRVEQRSSDVVLRLVAADGRETWADQPLGFHQPELLLVPADEYRLEIETRSPGPFAVSWTWARDDEPRLEGDLAWTEAVDLYRRDRDEDRPAARAAFERAAAAWSTPGLRAARARALLGAAHLAEVDGASDEALAIARRALALRTSLGDRQGQAEAQHLLGHVHRQRAELEAAGRALHASLGLSESVDDDRGRARALLNLGFLDQQAGRSESALGRYEAALELAWRLGDRALEAKLLNNLAGLDFEAGRLAQAVGRFEALERLHRQTDDARSQARTWINLAAARRALGRYQGALDAYGAALEVLGRLDDVRLEATTLNNLGFTYLRLGDPVRARDRLREALEKRRQVGDRRGEAVTANNLGLAAMAAEDFAEAEHQFRRALALRGAVGDTLGEATTLYHLGRLARLRSAPAQAREPLERALATLRERGARSRAASVAVELSRVHHAEERFEAAFALADEAVTEHRRLGDRDGEAEALLVRALARRDGAISTGAEPRPSASELALVDLERAMELVESNRLGLRSPDLRATLLAVEREVFEQAIDLSMERGDTQAAFVLAERSRARSLLDVLFEPTERTEPETELGQRRTELREALAGVLYAMDRQRRRGRAPAEPLEARRRQLSIELDRLEQSAFVSTPDGAADLGPGILDPGILDPGILDPGRLRALLDPRTRALIYSLGDRNSYLWWIDAEGGGSVRLPPRTELDALVARVHGDLSTLDPSGYRAERERARELSNLLLGALPERADLRRFVIVPEGSLRLLPFEALPWPRPGVEGDRPGVVAARSPDSRVLDHREVVYLPSVSSLPLLRRLAHRPRSESASAAAGPELALVADPLYRPAVEGDLGPRDRVGSRDRVGPRDRGALSDLPSSRLEAEAIMALGGERTRAWLGARARPDAVAGDALEPFRYVHFATHGQVDGARPEATSLVLSLFDEEGRPVDGHLRLRDVESMRLTAELVVASGCRTALGQHVRGEGFLGLGRAFFLAGAARVVASLWQVDDRATATLVTRFYERLLQDGQEPAAALHGAKIDLRSDRRYRDPYYWAAFLLHGDWQDGDWQDGDWQDGDWQDGGLRSGDGQDENRQNGDEQRHDGRMP